MDFYNANKNKYEFLSQDYERILFIIDSCEHTIFYIKVTFELKEFINTLKIKNKESIYRKTRFIILTILFLVEDLMKRFIFILSHFERFRLLRLLSCLLLALYNILKSINYVNGAVENKTVTGLHFGMQMQA